VVGVALSIGTAYLAQSFNSINDFLQLVFSFVNAPLFATFLLGMFWKRTTGHGAFFGLLCGTLAAAATHGLSMSEGKGAWIANIHHFPSPMAQNFWIAIMAWVTCFIVTVLVSAVSAPKPVEELRGLVYGVTDIKHDEEVNWYARPLPIAIGVGLLAIILNIVFY